MKTPFVNDISEEEVAANEANNFVVQFGNELMELEGFLIYSKADAEYALSKAIETITDCYNGENKRLAVQALQASINTRILPFRLQ